MNSRRLLHGADLDLGVLLAIAGLSMDEREAFVDSLMVGRTYADIAARSGLSLSRVGENAITARRKLATSLDLRRVAA